MFLSNAPCSDSLIWIGALVLYDSTYIQKGASVRSKPKQKCWLPLFFISMAMQSFRQWVVDFRMALRSSDAFLTAVKISSIAWQNLAVSIVCFVCSEFILGKFIRYIPSLFRKL